MIDEIVYVCDHCGEAFTLENAKHLVTDIGGDTLCPNCGSTDIEEATRCKVCREIVREYELKSGVCQSCFNDAVSAFKACINYLQPWEREVLDDEYGNIDITEN